MSNRLWLCRHHASNIPAHHRPWAMSGLVAIGTGIRAVMSGRRGGGSRQATGDPPEWRHMEVAGGVENNEARVGSNATLIVAMVGVSIRRPGDDDMTWPEAVSSVHRPMGIAMMERSFQQTGRSSVMRTELRGFPKRATKVSTTVSGDPDLECNKYCQGSFCA